MSREILTAKLGQLEDQVERLHTCIHMSEAASHSQLKRQIDALERECVEAESALRRDMQRSKSGLVPILAQSYDQVGRIIQSSKQRLQALEADSPDVEAVVEEKLLLAEYALDFAHLAAARALLISMDAIDAQIVQEEEGITI